MANKTFIQQPLPTSRMCLCSLPGVCAVPCLTGIGCGNCVPGAAAFGAVVQLWLLDFHPSSLCKKNFTRGKLPESHWHLIHFTLAMTLFSIHLSPSPGSFPFFLVFFIFTPPHFNFCLASDRLVHLWPSGLDLSLAQCFRAARCLGANPGAAWHSFAPGLSPCLPEDLENN